MPSYISLTGGLALSNFRQKRLLTNLLDQGVPLTDISAEYVYFIWSDVVMTQDQISRSLKLLNSSGTSLINPMQGTIDSLLVVPRIGTISPWASKATEIAHHCNLPVLRLERGIKFVWSSKKPLPNNLHALVINATHDRMTESVLSQLSEANQLYQILPDKNFSRINLVIFMIYFKIILTFQFI